MTKRTRTPGRHHKPFTRAMWDMWLERLNADPDTELEAGIKLQRALLDVRCLGHELDAKEAMAQRRLSVEKHLGRSRYER